MLNLKNTSWLYRFLNFNGSKVLHSKQLTLCKLFWTTVFHVCKDIVLGIVIAMIAALPALWIGTDFALIAKGFIYTSAAFWQVPTLIVSGTIMWAVFLGLLWCVITVCMVLVQYINEKTENWRDNRKFKAALKEEMARDEELSWSNLWQKAKIAKKDKLCPLVRIEYVE